MNIHEYQAKEILRKYNIPTSIGVVVLSSDDIDRTIDSFESDVYVVKAQIHAGGRGKAGGVKVTKDKASAKAAAHNMWGMQLITHQTGLEGQKVQRIYIESGCNIKKEYYFSAALDRANSVIAFVASTEGGVDIEEVAHNNPEKIVKVHIDPGTGVQPFHGRRIAGALGFTGDVAKQMQKIVDATYNAFIGTDASQIEINPLVLDINDKLIALDAKINFDDNALFKHPDILSFRDEAEENPLEIRAANAHLSYVKMDGSIGCMVNGAGLAMATMDIIKLYGAEPANFLDVGGGADQARVTEALKIILSDKNVKAILVNIFGGIMRCDIIAEGIIAAAKDIGIEVPLVVRLAGTNFELGKEILAKSGLKIIAADDLADAAQKVVEQVR
ncbi:MAG: ADP-forming succinate--CoA ligase subunit beta [Rickettsiaceae bacterium]|nr:ADP-forming succinate--CoA ligase subunit beta [Rickettsiaceae bacterium]